MKHTVTAALALAAVAGLAGAATAQTMAPQGTMQSTQTQPNMSAPVTPAERVQGTTTAPSYSYQPQTTAPAPQASAQTTEPQQAGGDFWSRNISQQEVQQAQEQLKAAGLYNGPADGIMGTRTKRAIARFQRQNGMRVNGTLDESTLARLANTTSGVGASSPTNPEATTAPPSAGASSYGTPTTNAPVYQNAPNSYGGQNPYQPSPAARPMYR
jgi:peptidoglycan hydrolase-like protein with peptidoglycan-binding domain